MEYTHKLDEIGITLKKSGKQVCPKCSHTRKNKTDKCCSVTFGNDAVLYKCHNCGWTGAVFYRDKFEYKKQFKRPTEPKQSDNKTLLYNYFDNRGISKEVLEKYKIGINQNNEIILPYYKNGELVNVKYRTFDKKFRQEAETEKTFFGTDEVTGTKQIAIVEGEIDVLSCAEYGIEAVSVPQGASENKLECIDNCWDWLQQFETYIIAVDNDSAGDKLKMNLISRLGKHKCKIANFKQYKDSNEVLCDGGDLVEILQSAEYLNPDGVITFNDCIDEINDFYTNGFSKGYSTDWHGINRKLTIKTSRLMIVTGYPSRGKSYFIDNLLYNLSKKYDMRHLIASFENTNANHFARFAQMHTEAKFSDIPKDKLQEAFDFIAGHFYRLSIDKLWNIDSICEAAELAVRKYGIKTLTIDPYNRLQNDYTDREDKYIGSILAKLCMLAKKLDILVIFIAHPKKPDGEKMPTMYSISGSSDWYNMADYGLIIHRERNSNTGELENTPTVVVAKIKDFDIGDPSGGEVQLRYMPQKFKLVDFSNC